MTVKLIIAAVSLLLVGVLSLALLYTNNIIPHSKHGGEEFGIEDYISMTDKDGDGIDDQTDILQGARDYVATGPVYMSKYYASGWPDDEYGVCTDVIARALLAAGYDLMELMAEDREAFPDRYDADAGDKMILFRRVRNQLPFFKANFISLTTDIHDIDEWQGGDIVVWEGHVGIVSDKRNYKGIPFVIHHGSPDQREYEEDILESGGKIIGHFRVS